MTVKLTRPLVRAALDRAVARKGRDYVYVDHYPSCVYVNEADKPACLIGMVLIDLGVPASAFHQTDPAGMERTLNGLRFDVAYKYLPVVISDEVMKALVAAQYIQDDGGTWGRARDRAVADLDKA